MQKLAVSQFIAARRSRDILGNPDKTVSVTSAGLFPAVEDPRRAGKLVSRVCRGTASACRHDLEQFGLETEQVDGGHQLFR